MFDVYIQNTTKHKLQSEQKQRKTSRISKYIERWRRKNVEMVRVCQRSHEYYYYYHYYYY